MAGQNDFLIFDENSENILTQALYETDDDREDGFRTGLARSNVTNKVLRQVSIMASALGELIKTQGGQATDSSLANLVGSLKRLYSIKNYYLDATYAEDDVVISIIDDEVRLYRSLVNNNIGNQLSDTTKWESVELGGGSSRNIGEIVASTIPLTDAGLHLLDGALISGSGSYADFVDYIADLYDSGDYTAIFETEANWQTAVTTYGVCGKFVYDSVNNTVRLPKYSNKIYTKDITSTAPVKGTGLSLGFNDGTNNLGLRLNASTTDNACMITGGYGVQVGSSIDTSGTIATNNVAIGVTTDGTKSGIVADLAGITTSLEGYYYIVVATSTKTDIEVDIDEIATDLNGKADVDLTNVTDSGTSFGASWAMPSSTYTNLTLGASGTTYTAPANGWYFIRKDSNSSSTQSVTLINITPSRSTSNPLQTSECMGARSVSTANAQAIMAYLPVKKGDIVEVTYTAGGNVDAFKFIYAQGSKGEA